MSAYDRSFRELQTRRESQLFGKSEFDAKIKSEKRHKSPKRPTYQAMHQYHQFWTAWRTMLKSCNQPSHPHPYEDIYPPWLDFLTFADWAKEQPNAWAMYPDGPIDFRRKSRPGGWFPGNCHFVWMSYEEREAREKEERREQHQRRRRR
jgi:hypothetical protein